MVLEKDSTKVDNACKGRSFGLSYFNLLIIDCMEFFSFFNKLDIA